MGALNRLSRAACLALTLLGAGCWADGRDDPPAQCLSSGRLPVITSSLMIQGHGATVRGASVNRIFWVEQGNVTLRQLVIAGGLAQGESGKNGVGGGAGFGGTIFVESGLSRGDCC